MSRRVDLATLAVAIAVHAGLAATIARGHTPNHPTPSTVELEFPRPAATVEHKAVATAPSSAAAEPPSRRKVAFHARPAVAPPVSRPAEAPLTPAPAAPPAPAAKPVFAVAMASTSEIAVPMGGARAAAASAPGGSDPAGGHGVGPSPGAGAGGSASESDVATMPEIDTDACGRTIVYPQEAEQAGIEGDVRLRVSLTPEGHVDGVRVLSGLGHGLDREAVEALRHRCRFSPAIDKGGKAVAFVIQSYVFHFELPR